MKNKFISIQQAPIGTKFKTYKIKNTTYVDIFNWEILNFGEFVTCKHTKYNIIRDFSKDLFISIEED